MLVATLAALLGLAALAAAKPVPTFEVVVHKGELGVVLNYKLDPFFIPDGQCSGELGSVVSCPAGVSLHAVRVAATDRVQYPHVHVSDDFGTVSVVRAPKFGSCSGDANVTVLLSCFY